MSFSHNSNRTLTVARPAFGRKSPGAQTLFMAACCLAMVAGTGLLIYSAPSGLTWMETLLLAAPMAGCLAMHVVMHRFMGRSCHSSGKTGGGQ